MVLCLVCDDLMAYSCVVVFPLCTAEHCCMLVGTMSPTQHFKTIGYGVCAKEDIAAHKFVLQQIKKAVEAVVERRAVAGERV